MNQRELEQKTKAVKRYGGTSFIVIERTYDPSIIENTIKPKNKEPLESSPGYIGYLWKGKDSLNSYVNTSIVTSCKIFMIALPCFLL